MTMTINKCGLNPQSSAPFFAGRLKPGRFRPLKLAMMIVGAVFLLTLGTPKASADYTFDLGLGNTAISGFAGPYATVDVALVDSTHANITFTSLANNGYIYLMGDGGSVGVNVNASSWTLGAITGSNAGTGFSPGPYSNGGGGNEDGWGSFNQTINSFGGYKNTSDTISFGLTNNSGTWANATDVLTGNASGYLAAAHIFVASDPANASGQALATGFAANGGSSSVPEPGSLVILSSFLLGLLTIARKERHTQA